MLYILNQKPQQLFKKHALYSDISIELIGYVDTRTLMTDLIWYFILLT